MLIKIAVILVLLTVVFVIVVALQPASFQVTRAISVSAPPAAVFAQVDDFHRWAAWSPWGKLDPEMKTTYTGAPAGTGAVYTWTGNSKVGEGRMEIAESHPGELVRINLQFLKPFKADNITEFTFKPEGNQTNVVWTMTGRNNFMSKAMQVFMSMDKMIGGDFDRGLAQLKAVAEAAPKS